jgi:Arylsulfotransferase (ASST)
MTDGVIRHDAERAFNGYTLFCQTYAECRREGEPPGIVRLIDMDGQMAHEWHTDVSVQSYCKLLPDGNLIHPTHDRSDVGVGSVGLYELTPESEVVWSYRCRTDHDFQILDSGNLLINTLNETMCPPLGPELKRHPYIVEVTRQKELVWEWRGEEHLAELEALLPPESWAFAMQRARGQFAFDWAHNNTVQVIPPNAAHDAERQSGVVVFAPGNFFISYRSLDIIAVVERPSGRILWAWGPGVIDGQHKPHMLPSGNILIFDNGTLRGRSRVIELNPMTQQIEWEYTGEPGDPFFSPYISCAQRLPNGNTLICDGGNARLVEVTSGKEIVWEFVTPWHPPRSYKSIYRCERYSPEYVAPLLDKVRSGR